MSDFDLALPLSRALTSGTGSPYAGGELKYSDATPEDAAQSNCMTIYPIGDYSSEYFDTVQWSDGVWELAAKGIVWGACSNPFAGSDHTRTEVRSRKRGSAPISGKGEFLQADKATLEGACRPMRWPDNDALGRPAVGTGTPSHNMTLYQIHDLSLVFVIVLFRKKSNGLGRIEFTSRNVDQSSRPTVILHDDVPLGSLLEFSLRWGPDPNLYSETRVDGGALNVQTISCDPGWAERPNYFKCYAYQGTPPIYSSDYLRGAVGANGVLRREDALDTYEVRYRRMRMYFAP